jgi:hypothetical protein
MFPASISIGKETLKSHLGGAMPAAEFIHTQINMLRCHVSSEESFQNTKEEVYLVA